MMLIVMQQFDAAVLMLIAACAIYLLCEDKDYTGWWPRAALSLFGVITFAQAMWLVGVWLPGASGFPWPRIALDASLAVLALTRVVTVSRIIADARRRIAHKI